MRKILIALLGVLLVAALAGAGTFAYFSDTETSTGNSFTAGTLDLTMNSNQTIPFSFSNMKPGDSGTITYTFTNAGNIDGYLDLENISVVDTEGANPESETNITDPGDLSANMDIAVKLDGNLVWSGKLSNWGTAGSLSDLLILAGSTRTLEIAWSVSTGVGNDIQGDVVTAGFTAELAQTAGQ